MFNIGDIITGNKDNSYSITNENAIMVVTDIIDCEDEEITVKVLKHYTREIYIEEKYNVFCGEFSKINERGTEW